MQYLTLPTLQIKKMTLTDNTVALMSSELTLPTLTIQTMSIRRVEIRPQPGDMYLFNNDCHILLSSYGRLYKQEIIETSRVQRSASGKLWTDIIAKKRKVTLTYDSIDDSALLDFIYLYSLGGSLIFQHYVRGGEAPDTFEVIMSPFEQGRLIAGSGGLWTGVAIVLEEV